MVKNKMTKEELVELIYENFYDEKHHCIDISYLDFSKYKCDIHINGITAVKDLRSEDHTVGGDLYQGYSEVAHSVYQKYITAGEDIFQGGHEVGGNLYQGEHTVGGTLLQSENEVDGDLEQVDQRVGGELCTYAPGDNDEVKEHYSDNGYMIIKQNDYMEE